jgi:hypothetical protein
VFAPPEPVRTSRVAGIGAVILLLALVSAGAALPPSLRFAARSAGPDAVTIDATDPAGRFTLFFRYGRLRAASFDGVALERGRALQRGDSVIFLDPDMRRDFAVRYHAAGGISWLPRPARP